MGEKATILGQTGRKTRMRMQKGLMKPFAAAAAATLVPTILEKPDGEKDKKPKSAGRPLMYSLCE